MTEWSLIVFTMALQMGCGLCLAATLFDMGSTRSTDAAMRPLGVLIFPLAALGLLASLFHLGRPLSALRSLSNLGSSRLSMEILLSVVFSLSAFVYSYMWRKRVRRARLATGVVTAIVGLAAVISSFLIYMIPSQPVWNSAWLPISFLGTLLLFAGLIPASLLELQERRLLRILLALAFAGATALLVSVALMLSALSRTVADDFSNARLQMGLHLLTSNYSVWLGCYLFLAILIPFAFAFRRWPRKNSTTEVSSPRTSVLLAALCGAVIGRALMYAIGGAVASF